MPSTKHSKESVVLGILERQSLWEQRLSIRDVANLETSTCEQRVDSCSVDVPASFQSNRRATELHQIIKPFNRGLNTWIRLGCAATTHHSEGMARGARDSSEAAAKIQSSAIESNTVHPIRRPYFNEPPQYRAPTQQHGSRTEV